MKRIRPITRYVNYKKLFGIGSIFLLLFAMLSGCNEVADNSSGANIKITSLNIEKTQPENEIYPYFKFIVALKNVGSGGDKSTVTANLYAWWDSSGYWRDLDFSWENLGYIDSGDTSSVTLMVIDRYKKADNYKVEITVETDNGENEWYDLELGGGYYSDVFKSTLI